MNNPMNTRASATNNSHHHCCQSDIHQAQKFMKSKITMTNTNAKSRISLTAITHQNTQPETQNKTISVMIPKNTFFKIYPDRQIEVSIAYSNNRWYLFENSIAAYYQGQLKKLSQATLYQGITEEGKNFILPVVKPWPGYTQSWYQSLNDIVKDATDKYLKIESDTSIDSYIVVDEKRLTNKVQWPQDDFEDLLAAAFPDEHYVDHEDHPLLDELYIG